MVEYQKAAADSLAAVFFMEEKIAVLRRLYTEVVSNSEASGAIAVLNISILWKFGIGKS